MRVSSLIYAGLGIGVLVAAATTLFHMNDRRDRDAGLEPFLTACVAPVLAGKGDVGPACRSTQAITDVYNINIRNHIDTRHALMKATARRIANGELLKPRDYKACIASGRCAEVPLLPENIDPEKMTAEQRAVSEAFWDLAEQDVMTKAVCDLMPECQAVVKLKVIDYGF